MSDKETYVKYRNFREMPEDRCGYCRICGEKTLFECDIAGAGYLKNPDGSSTLRHFGESDVPICEDCHELHKQRGDAE